MSTGATYIDQALMLGIALTRTAAAFSLTPIFSPQIIPPLIRNSICVAFGLIMLSLQPQAGLLHPTIPGWLALFGREIFIGVIIGLFFGGILWSFEAAGQMIDAKVGPAMSGLTDPFSGEMVALNTSVMVRLAVFAFMTMGGLTLMVNTLLGSYVIWPIAASAPHLNIDGTGPFEDQFASIVALAVGLAAPAIVLLTGLEAAMGLINRFVPQFNVFAALLAAKSWLAIFILLALLELQVNTLSSQVLEKASFLQRLLGDLAR